MGLLAPILVGRRKVFHKRIFEKTGVHFYLNDPSHCIIYPLFTDGAFVDGFDDILSAFLIMFRFHQHIQTCVDAEDHIFLYVRAGAFLNGIPVGQDKTFKSQIVFQITDILSVFMHFRSPERGMGDHDRLHARLDQGFVHGKLCSNLFL